VGGGKGLKNKENAETQRAQRLAEKNRKKKDGDVKSPLQGKDAD
jgi:hypothetical protein